MLVKDHKVISLSSGRGSLTSKHKLNKFRLQYFHYQEDSKITLRSSNQIATYLTTQKSYVSTLFF